jgi:WD40 repeat protein/serine/threonine protein kinase
MPTANREEALFAAALEKPTPAERAAYLEGACGDDHALWARIDTLLAAHEASSGVLDAPPSAITPTAAYRPLTEGPGTRVGPYKLLQQIGEGGMGVVYMAEQTEPVRRQVALKIIKPGMDSQQVIARFEAERQALAMMDHQNIARVLDANTTESGRPYFVMELVHGVPITQFCDANKLTPRERLELFVPVCQAIQHAHQKGIIHRDVKPSNVLVTMYDDKPVPKVIDFGVAKAVEQRLTEKTMFTQFGALVGTFEYMSPEQAEINAFGVDTRSDIYSLGVLLYELLAGTTPLERKRLREAALDEMVRLIKEEEAPRPSVRLSSSNNLLKIAAARKTEPERLSKLVRGEIDWIVMKCLEKNRSRRYDTASGQAKDIERYLHDEPVEACPPSARYRLREIVRKYKKALVTAAAFVVLLVAGVVTSTLLAVWATTAERSANQERIASDEARREAVGAKSEADKQRDEARLAAYASGIGLVQRYWDENNVVRCRELLGEMPQEAAGQDLRGFEWYYLSRLCNSEALTLNGHTGDVGSVAFSLDGRRLASGSRDKTVKIWDSATGKELLSLKGHTEAVMSVAFSPNGQRLASGSWDKTVKIWDSVIGKELLSLKGHTGIVLSVAFSPDGQRLASGSQDMMVKIWDSATGKELLSLGHAGEVASVAFSPDGRQLASGSNDGGVELWDSAIGKKLFSLQKGPTDSVRSVAFSPDGRRLASGSNDKTVKIWDSVTGKVLFSLDGHAGPVESVAFSPDGQRLASGSADRTVKTWDSRNGKELFSLKGHAVAINSVAFSPDGQRLASGSDDLTVKLWDSTSGKELFSFRSRPWGSLEGLAFSPDGRRLASGSYDQTVIWDSATGKELLSLKGHTAIVMSVAFSPDGQRLASVSYDKTVKIWDSATGKELLSLMGHTDLVMSVAFSPDGRHLASGSDDKTVKIWDSVTGKELLSLKGHTQEVNSVAFSPDGKRLASGSYDKTVKIWDSSTGKELLSLKGHTDSVRSVAFSPDSQRLASGSNDKTVKLWHSATGEELFSLKGHTDFVLSVAFSADGRRLASGSLRDQTVKLWDIATGKELYAFKGRAAVVFKVAGGLRSVTFSPDGQRLASSNMEGSINLWEASVSPEVQDCRAVHQLVSDLFQQMGLRADVLERLRTVPAMSPSRRQAALAVAQTYPENPLTLNNLAWERVKLPGREMVDYRKALRYSEETCQLEPKNGNSLNTLGVAHYRAGNYDKALETLRRSDAINKIQYHGSLPADLAFLAMSQQHLGRAKEAQAFLQRLRLRMKDARWANDADAQGFLREAEALLAKPKTPGGK